MNMDTCFQFICISSKTVKFEDGRFEAVQEFEISKYNVTVGDFNNFVNTTGYCTAAEAKNHPETFRNHCGLSGLSAIDRSRVPVQFITIDDAEAYCRFAGCRLPTEAEWLAASLLDDQEVDLSPFEELERRCAPLPFNAMQVNNWDMTAQKDNLGNIITRRGPHIFLLNSWRDPLIFNFNRRIVSKNECDMSISFRVVK